MSLKIKVIGIGAAGNKAAIQLVESGILKNTDVLLLNSTLRDIPDQYKTDLAIEFGDTKGCGKERALAQRMMVDALYDGQIPMDKFIDGDEKFFVIVTSTEGGTGSGASIALGEYLQEATKAPVHMVCFTGFQDDARGLKNTVDWFKELNDNFIVQSISNQKCLAHVDGNRRRAEEYANKVFAERIAILSGQCINPSYDNIDNTDLFKLNATPGYMSVEKIPLEKIKDEDQFNATLKKALDMSVSLDTEPSVKRIGIIINASNKIQAVVDESFQVVKDKYGFPTEIFRHPQDSDMEDYVAIIVSGMKLPVDEIKELYSKFKRQMQKIDLDKDSFFNIGSQLDTSFGNGLDIGSQAKNPIIKNEAGKEQFFAKYGKAKKQNVEITTTARDEL